MAAEKRPALTHPAPAGGSILRSGRGKACGAVEQEKGEEERKRVGGGLDMPGAHISRFSMVMRPMRARSSGAIGWRPGLPGRRERRRQYVRQPWRCHRSTVSGLTMRREVRQPLNQRHAKIQKRRSASPRRGRGMRRCRTSSCCRRQRLSAISSAFGWTAAAIAHRKQRSIDVLPLNRQEADASQWPSIRTARTDHNFAPFTRRAHHYHRT